MQDNSNLQDLEKENLYLKKQLSKSNHLVSTLNEYKMIIDNMIIVTKTNKDGILTYANEHFCNISGYQEEELLGKPHNIIRHPDTPPDIFKQMWQDILSDKVWYGTIKNRRKDGSDYYVKATIIPMHDKNGNIIEFLGLREDVSDIIKATIKIDEEKHRAQEAEKAKAFFLASMSHEIRTPMNGIVGFTKLLSSTSLNLEQKKYTSLIEDSTKTLINIVNDILDYSKIESKKLSLDPTKNNLFLELHSLLSQFEITAKEKEIKLSMFIDPKIKECINIDILRLKQVLSNLISNALKFTYREGKIDVLVTVIQTYTHEQHISFEIIDNGIGMDCEQQKKIFLAFEQADKSTTRKFGGTGLGLSISSSLVKLMDSSLKIKSEPNKGSNFYFKLKVPFHINNLNIKNKLKNKKITLIQTDEHKEHLKVQKQLDSFNIKYEKFLKKAPNNYDIYICFNIFIAKELSETINTQKQHIVLIYPIDNIIESAHVITNYEEFPSSLYKLLYNDLNVMDASNSSDCIDIKLLIAEDYELNRVLISEILNKCSIKPDFAINGQEAIEKARANQYDLILMDINMPIINGIDATKVIRLKDKITPIIALSANVMEEDKQAYLNSGMNDFLPKPIEANKLYQVIKHYQNNIQIPEKIIKKENEIDTNLQEAIDALGLPKDTIKNLILKFVSDSKESLNRLLQTSPDTKKIEKYFHTFKGTAATLKLEPIAILAKEVELSIKENKYINYTKKEKQMLKLLNKVEKHYK